MRALIIDQGQDRGSLVAARALARDGWTVGSASQRDVGLVGRSRAVTSRHRIPPLEASPSEFVAALNDAIAEGGYEVILSCSDASVLKLSQHRAELNTTFPYGDHAAVERSFDKLELTRAAQRAGLDVPRTEPAGERELASFGSGPIVVKPRLTFLEGEDRRFFVSVEPDAESARERVRELREAGAEPMIQEHSEGNLMAFTTVTDRDARMVAQVQQVADRTWPVGVGVSAYAHTVPINETLAKKVGRLLEELGWFGLAELQFILGGDGVPRLLDLNGRLYGSLALAVGAGPNLPAIWARLATGRPVGRVPQARPGVRYQWLSGDLQSSLSTANGTGRIGVALGAAMRAPRAVHSVWCATDPWPAACYFASRLAARTRSS